MSDAKVWTEEENKILREYYGGSEAIDVYPLNRTVTAVREKAERVCGKASDRKWTDKEQEVLREQYRAGDPVPPNIR